MPQQAKFWMVWNPNGHQPVVKHSNEKIARGESERLALANPGREFYVLEAICCAKKVEVAVNELVHPDYMDVDIPF